MLKITVLMLYSVIKICASSVESESFHQPIKACRIGDVVRNECTRCLCTSKTVFECQRIDCIRGDSQEIHNPASTEQVCIPNQLYIQNLITCICTKDGLWPHNSCHETFQSLPATSIESHKCDPNSYVTIDCNICKCSSDGEFITNRCTKNVCDAEESRRLNKEGAKSDIYGNCETFNWYSLAPCQFCFCVNKNKLVCNTGYYDNRREKLELGSYDMHVCGKEMLREAIELIPDAQRSFERFKAKLNITKRDRTSSFETGLGYRSDNESLIQNHKVSVTNVDPDDKNNYGIGVKDNANDGDARMELETVVETESEEAGSKEDNGIAVAVDIGQISDTGITKENIDYKEQKKTKAGTKFGDSFENAKGSQEMEFKRGFRKAISLGSGFNCSPGSSYKKDCNTCFCMKNGKLVCTTNKCN